MSFVLWLWSDNFQFAGSNRTNDHLVEWGGTCISTWRGSVLVQCLWCWRKKAKGLWRPSESAHVYLTQYCWWKYFSFKNTERHSPGKSLVSLSMLWHCCNGHIFPNTLIWFGKNIGVMLTQITPLKHINRFSGDETFLSTTIHKKILFLF